MFYHMNDVSVYLGDGGREGSLLERTHFTHAFFVLNQEQYIFQIVNVRNYSVWGENYKIRPQVHYFGYRCGLCSKGNSHIL